MQHKQPETQADTVLAFMKGYGSITSMQAYSLGITRLSAVIYNLRHKRGLTIVSTPCKAKTRFGTTVYSKYTLKEEVA